jgi:hypothetical protein
MRETRSRGRTLTEQDHRGIKGRIRCIRGFKEHDAADRFCHGTMNSATSSVADPVTTNTFQQPAVRRFLRHARITIMIRCYGAAAKAR